MKVTNSISLRLLKKVFFIYFSITFIITTLQILVEFYETKNIVKEELVRIEKTFAPPLKEAIWNFNNAQVESIASSMFELSFVKEVAITDPSGNTISKMTKSDAKNIFSHQFEILKEYEGKTAVLARVSVSSDQNTVIDMVKTGIYLLILSAVIKSLLLLVLFLWAFKKYLTVPLSAFTEQLGNINFANMGQQKISVEAKDGDELYILQNSFNAMVDKLEEQKKFSLQIKQEYVDRLEKEVRERTLELENSNMQLKFISTADYLTGVRNNRSFYDVTGQYFETAKKGSNSLHILLISIDDFNNLNDKYGIQFGDDILKLFTVNMKEFLQKSDIFGRLGSNEFALALFDAAASEVEARAAEIIKLTSTTHIKHDNENIFLSASLGIASLSSGDNTLDDLITRAQTALDEAKRQGNRYI